MSRSQPSSNIRLVRFAGPTTGFVRCRNAAIHGPETLTDRTEEQLVTSSEVRDEEQNEEDGSVMGNMHSANGKFLLISFGNNANQ